MCIRDSCWETHSAIEHLGREGVMTGQGKSAIDTLLAESFKELALKQPIEKITIRCV